MNNDLIERFDKIITFIKRENIENFVNWIKNETDFFTAPASTIYHGNYDGGLATHSIFVTEYALTLFNFTVKKKPDYEYMRESIVLCALFHDICKINQYVKEEKWIKDKNNKWSSYQGYSVKDTFPMGHGPKSVYLINQFIKLKNEEVLAITHHMGWIENSPIGITKYAYGEAFNHPLVKIIQAADIMAGAVEDTIDYKSLAIK